MGGCGGSISALFAQPPANKIAVVVIDATFLRLDIFRLKFILYDLSIPGLLVYNGAVQIVGIDEAGRGCWAGPLVAAAVLLKRPIKGLKDSKQLTFGQRERLAGAITQMTHYGVGWVGQESIDALGLTRATRSAMRAALMQLKVSYDAVIIDGSFNYLNDNEKAKAIIRADVLMPSVSAASILAKVERDRFMRQQAVLYPQYFFEKHVGYGTLLHRQMLEMHGPCKLHRLSYEPVRAFS